jgi:hypothetical protein
LDNIRDPAERQVAVECLVIISRIEARNPEITLSRGVIDLTKLINESIRLFWIDWVAEHSQSEPVLKLVTPNGALPDSPVKKHGGHLGLNVQTHDSELSLPLCSSSDGAGLNGDSAIDLSFERNGRLARRLFFDVPQDGDKGTSNYLAQSCMSGIFEIKLL